MIAGYVENISKFSGDFVCKGLHGWNVKAVDIYDAKRRANLLGQRSKLHNVRSRKPTRPVLLTSLLPNPERIKPWDIIPYAIPH